MTFELGVGARITGADVAYGRVNRFRATTLKRMQEEAVIHAQNAVSAMQTAIAETYTAPGSGKLGRNISFRLNQLGNGVEVQLVVPNYRELGFLTDLTGGTFHGAPYPIFAKNVKVLRFFWRRIGGVFMGPRVIHPGFNRDVLAEEGHRQMAIWADRMERSFRNSVADILFSL